MARFLKYWAENVAIFAAIFCIDYAINGEQSAPVAILKVVGTWV